MSTIKAINRFRIALTLFIIGLLFSGLTAFPLLEELKIIVQMIGLGGASSPEGYNGVAYWILTVRFGLGQVYTNYPWIAYGTDWLAFGHIVIALFFIYPWIYPAQSRANLYVGVVACILVLPLAFLCGSIRGIPLYWRFIDSAFGLFGVIPLLYCLRMLAIIDKGSYAPIQSTH